MSKTSELRSSINEKLISALENDTIPWRRPWTSPRNAGRHSNFVTRRAYSGANPLILELHSLRHGFGSNFWMTFNQAKSLGCSVKKRPSHVPPGQFGCSILLYRPYDKTVVNRQTGEEEEERRLALRTFTVFNCDQIEGKAIEEFEAAQVHHHDDTLDFQPAEELIAATKADISHFGDRAFYRRPLPKGTWPNHTEGDNIVMPPRERFHTLADYYSTLLHELSHFAEVRVGWEHDREGYEAGELVAEMASVYLSAELRLPPSDLENHARYLRTWLQAMKADHNFIFRCSSQASKTTDYLLSFVRKPDGDGNPLPADDAEVVVGANS